MRKLLAALFGVLLIFGVGGALKLGHYAITPLNRAAPPEQSQAIVVQKGMGPREIAAQLQQLGAIADADQFVWLGRVLRRWGRIKAGEYEVSPAIAPLEIFARITSGVSMAHPLTVREGENMYEVASAFEERGIAPRKKILGLFKSREYIESLGVFKSPLPLTLEGYLYPETYFFNRTQTPEEMVKQMVKLSLSHWGAEHETRARELGLSRHQVYTLASIVEKETGQPSDRPIISSVFHNRLKKKMRLQTDPTAIYGVWDHYDGNIHKSTLRAQNAYNTYVISGLPIGPISNPGKLSLHAALYPAETEFLYFVSQNDGTTTFSRTYGEHNVAVKKYQLDPKARAGKSWRDLGKKK